MGKKKSCTPEQRPHFHSTFQKSRQEHRPGVSTRRNNRSSSVSSDCSICIVTEPRHHRMPKGTEAVSQQEAHNATPSLHHLDFCSCQVMERLESHGFLSRLARAATGVRALITRLRVISELLHADAGTVKQTHSCYLQHNNELLFVKHNNKH